MKDFKPLNPWGRAMPKAAPVPEPLCQLFVRSRAQRRDIPVGPKMPFRYLEPLMAQVNASVDVGAEKDWCDARIISLAPTPTPRGRSGLTVADVLANPSLLKV